MPVVSRSLVGAVTSSTVKLNGLRVEAWHATGICSDLIDVAVTDARGHFEMTLDGGYLAEVLPQKVPKVAFRTFDNGKPVAQAQQVVWRVAMQTTRLQIPLADEPSTGTPRDAAKPTPQLVRGQLRGEKRERLAGTHGACARSQHLPRPRPVHACTQRVRGADHWLRTAV